MVMWTNIGAAGGKRQSAPCVIPRMGLPFFYTSPFHCQAQDQKKLKQFKYQAKTFLPLYVVAHTEEPKTPQ